MENVLSVLIVIVSFLIIILFKFNPRISKVEDESVISYIIYYTIKGKYGGYIRDYFILIKYNK